MGLTRTIILAALCLLILISSADARKRKSRRSKRNHATCRAKSLVRYQMTVHTTWDKETFPKMFPTYRPPAHWSQLIGRSHGNNYRMWQEGGNASLAVQKFAEREDAKFFDLELSQGYNDVLDAFVAPTVETSVGQTSTVVSLDGGHSKVSFMMKIVPSPDWFIGLDSAELCYRGRWKRRYSRDLQPFDAGTDQGLTFTSPKWPNDPKEPISSITSSFPNHPASSFFYPEYKVLPRLAHVEFEIISEYRLRKVHKEIETPLQNSSDATSDNIITKAENIFRNMEEGDISPKIASFSPENKPSDMNSDASINKEIMRQPLFSIASNLEKKDSNTQVEHPEINISEAKQRTRQPRRLAPEMRSLSVSDTKRPSIGRRGGGRNRHVASKTKGHETDDMKFNEDIKDSQLLEEITTQDSMKDYKQRVSCQVSEWSEWSPCSQTCGFGNKQRSREPIVLPRHGGANCPLLKEETLCGSMRNCEWKHFSLTRSHRRKGNPRFRTLRRKLVGRPKKH